jgi:hypothetical protein
MQRQRRSRIWKWALHGNPPFQTGTRFCGFTAIAIIFQTNSKNTGRKGSELAVTVSLTADEASRHGEQSKRLMPLGNGNRHWRFAMTPAIINECA